MIKNLLLTSAALLSITGVSAEDLAEAPKFTNGQTQDYNNVSYKLTGTTIDPTQTTPGSVTITDNKNGSITVVKKTINTQTYTGTIDVAVSSISSVTEITIGNFTINGEINNIDNNPSNYNYDKNNIYREFSNDLPNAICEGFSIKTWSQIPDEGNQYIWKYVSGTVTLVGINKSTAIAADENVVNYYYVFDRNFYYIIDNIELISYKDTKDVYNITYNVTQIGNNETEVEKISIAYGNDITQDIRINCGVSYIIPGAFYNATALTSVKYGSSYGGTKPLYWDNQKNILYNADKTNLIYAATNVAQTIKLDNTVDSISAYAFSSINTENVTVTSDLLATEIKVNKDLQGSKVTFDFKTKIQESSELNGKGCAVTGTITNSDVITILTKNSNCLYFDFTNADIRGEITINNSTDNNNKLYYFPANTKVNGTNKNVVIGGNCATFSLKDATSFYNKHQFVATSAFLDRAMPSNQWGTAVVPFPLQFDRDEEGDWMGSFSGFENNSLKFGRVYGIAANTPFVYMRRTGIEKPFQATGVTIKETSSMSNVSYGDATFMGTYEAKTLGSGNYAYTTSGSFIQCNNNTLNPFRAHWKISSSQSAPSMRFYDEFDQEVIFENSTAISGIEEENNSNIIYNIKGQKVDNMNTPGIYVVNGKKITVK